MMSRRTIRGEKYNIEQIVDSAIRTVDAGTLNINAARRSLAVLGHTNPTDAMVNQYARDKDILAILTKQTGAAFNGQIGKIEFTNRDKAVSQVDAYLNRRNAGNRSRWGG